MSGVALFSGGNLSRGEREDRSNRWVLVAFAIIALAAYLPAYTDRKDIWTLDGDTIPAGLASFPCRRRCAAPLASLVLGCRFSGLVAIQPGHTLVTTGIYASRFHPELFGVARQLAGVGTCLRSGVGVLLTALTIPLLLARMRAEEALLRTHFGGE